MTTRPPELLLGRIAVQNKLITMDQLVEATMQQGREPNKRLGDILVEQGWISAKQLQKLIQAQQQLQARQQAAAGAQAKPAPAATPAAAPTAAPAAIPVAPAPAAAPAAIPVAATPAAAPVAIPVAPATVAAGPASAQEGVTPIPVSPAPVQDWSQPLASPAAAQAAAGSAAGQAGAGVAVAEPPAPAQAVAPAAPTADSQAPGSKQLDALLAKGVQAGASDIHVHSGAAIKMRVHGKLLDVSPSALDKTTAESLLLNGLTPEQRQEFEKKGELDFAYTLANVGRFRANIYRQLRGVDATFRAIPASPPALQELGLPTALAKLTNFHQGMVLITGPAGCGKSTTLASLLNIINEERQDHIITIEDPIEYLHPSKRCLVNQRQVGKNTESFARALRAALREDPDIIAIGELRDLETISLAITAAETGHLVLATLHTNSTTRTINRVLGVFPPDQQSQIRVMVSESLRAIISQRLIPTADGKKRVAALEVLVCNKAVSNLIREDKTFQIRSVLQTGTAQGMCLMDGSLAALVKSGAISKEEALRNCEDVKRFAG